MQTFHLRFVIGIVAASAGLALVGATFCQRSRAVSGEEGAADAPPPRPELRGPLETAFPDIKPPVFSDNRDRPRFSGKIPVRVDSNDPLRRLAQERLLKLVEAASEGDIRILGGAFEVQSSQFMNLSQIWRDVLATAEDVFGLGEELIHWYEEWVAVTKRLEKVVRARYEAGTAREQEARQVRAERLYAERELLKVMARVKAAGAK
jgi:hypothetical protein